MQTRMAESRSNLLRTLTLAAISVWLIQTPQVSVAEPQPTAAARETARALMQEGDQLATAGDNRAALTRYEAAHALVRIPTTGLEVARTQVKLGQLVEARGLAMEMSNTAPTAGEPPVYARARTAAAELARDLAARIPSVRTDVTPADSRYSLTIDGQPLPKEARTIAFRLNPGTHIVVVAAHGYVTQRKEVKLVERQAAVLTVALAPAPAATTAGPVPTPAPGKGTAAR